MLWLWVLLCGAAGASEADPVWAPDSESDEEEVNSWETVGQTQSDGSAVDGFGDTEAVVPWYEQHAPKLISMANLTVASSFSGGSPLIGGGATGYAGLLPAKAAGNIGFALNAGIDVLPVESAPVFVYTRAGFGGWVALGPRSAIGGSMQGGARVQVSGGGEFFGPSALFDVHYQILGEKRENGWLVGLWADPFAGGMGGVSLGVVMR